MAKTTFKVNYHYVMACTECGWYYRERCASLCPRCGRFTAKWQPGKLITTTTHRWYGNKTVTHFEPHSQPSVPPDSE